MKPKDLLKHLEKLGRARIVEVVNRAVSDQGADRHAQAAAELMGVQGLGNQMSDIYSQSFQNYQGQYMVGKYGDTVHVPNLFGRL